MLNERSGIGRSGSFSGALNPSTVGGQGWGSGGAPSSSMPQSGSGESVAALASCFHLIELNATEAMAPQALKWTTADRAAEPDAEASSSSSSSDDDDDDDDEVFEYILDDKENQKREQEDKEEGESDEDDDYRSRKRRSSNRRGAAAVSARGRHALEREGLFGIDEEIVEEDTDDGSVATSSKLPKKEEGADEEQLLSAHTARCTAGPRRPPSTKVGPTFGLASQLAPRRTRARQSLAGNKNAPGTRPCFGWDSGFGGGAGAEHGEV
mgnify:CR=1 FL=1